MVNADDLVIKLGDDNHDDFALCDAYLLGIAWSRDPPEIRLRLETDNKRQATLICSWATDVNIDLKDTHVGGPPLALGAQFEREGKGWRMQFEFPPWGVIELRCNEVRLAYDEPPTASEAHA